MKDYGLIISLWKINNSIRKIAAGPGDEYTNVWLLNYPYLKNYYKIKVIDLSKQQTLDADQKVMEQINFIANLYWDGNTTMLFILKEVKETT